MTENDIKVAVYDRLQHLLQRCCDHGVTDIKMPDIEFYDNKLAAGIANYKNWAVKFNLPMFKENYISMMHETVAHELAHLVVYHRWVKAGFPKPRPRPHGKEWQSVMLDWFRVVPETTHDYCTKSTKARKQKRWQAICISCSKIYKVSTTLQMRMAMGQRRNCRCGHEVKLTGKEA